MSVTYTQFNETFYNLTQNTREVGDIHSLSREQLGRSNFTRDQMLAAKSLKLNRTTLILEAARGAASLRNLHSQMHNTNATGGFGGLGYATNKDNQSTKDYALPSEGNGISALKALGKITGNESDYLITSQMICKPHSGIFGRYAELQGVQGYITVDRVWIEHGANTPEGHWEYSYALTGGPEFENITGGISGPPVQNFPQTYHIDHINYVEHTATTTTVLAIAKGYYGLETVITLPVSLDANVTYWFVKLYDKVNKGERLLAVVYDTIPKELISKATVTNNYPNMPLSRAMPYSQTHLDTYNGGIQPYPSTEARDAYFALHQAELDTLDMRIGEQTVLKNDAQEAQDDILTDLGDLTEEEQDRVTRNYVQDVLPALQDLLLIPDAYTQLELDELRITWEGDWAKNIKLDTIEASQTEIETLLPGTDGVIAHHTMYAVTPYTIAETAAQNEINLANQRIADIHAGAPKSDLTNNLFYSEWGYWTFYENYPKWGSMYETFMSKGFPYHEPVRRFVAKIGLNPRTLSDVIKAGVQKGQQSGGDSRTICDQLFFGCQATGNMSYAEMRYMIEFARSAWWNTMWHRDSPVAKRSDEAISSSAGISAWGLQTVEETMLSAGDSSMRSMMTRWESCDVRIEEGQVGEGLFGEIAITQTMRDQAPGTRERDTFDQTKEGMATDYQDIVGSYNLDNGFVLRVELRGIQNIAYTQFTTGNHSLGVYVDHPVVPLFYNVLRAIPQGQVCQLSDEFVFIRSHTNWKMTRSNWVDFRDTYLVKIVGLVLTVVGFVLAVPSGGATLSWSSVGMTLLYAAIVYAAVKVIEVIVKKLGLENTWIGGVIAVVITIVAIYYGMPVADASLLATTMTADAMANVYEEINMEEAREHAGLMARFDTVLDDLAEQAQALEEERQWLEFYSSSDLLKMRQDAVDYVKSETPDQYYSRMMNFNGNSLSLEGLSNYYDFKLDLDFT